MYQLLINRREKARTELKNENSFIDYLFMIFIELVECNSRNISIW